MITTRQSLNIFTWCPFLYPESTFLLVSTKIADSGHSQKYAPYVGSGIMLYPLTTVIVSNFWECAEDTEVRDSWTSCFGYGQSSCSWCWPKEKRTLGTRMTWCQISENAQKIRKSVIRGLPALVMARVRVLGADQKKSWLWRREWLNVTVAMMKGKKCRGPEKSYCASFMQIIQYGCLRGKRLILS